MKLSDCEISHRVVRGTIVVFLFGARALSAEECADLLRQYVDAHGPGVVPAYVSPDGWQVLTTKSTWVVNPDAEAQLASLHSRYSNVPTTDVVVEQPTPPAETPKPAGRKAKA